MLGEVVWAWTVLLAVLAFAAFRAGVLDGPGTLLAFVFGTVILWGLGLGALALLVFFTGMGFLVTRLGYERKRRIGAGEPGHGRRGWRNVFANGVTATAVGGTAFWLADGLLLLPFTVAVAIAAADTFASEIGALSPQPVLVTRPREHVPAGTNGGVSWLGTIASFLGAGLVAAAAHMLVDLGDTESLLVVVAGPLGSLLDSVLGATWEASPGHHDGPLTKQDVNLIAISIPTLVVFSLRLAGWV